MIEKQREKEFLFELERLYHNYFLAVSCTTDGDLMLVEMETGEIDLTTKQIERYIDMLRDETLEDEPKPLDSVLYKGVPFFYHPCFCDSSIGENCEQCCSPHGTKPCLHRYCGDCGIKGCSVRVVEKDD